MDDHPDEAYVEIRELELKARIGVPDDERAQLQRLTVSLKLWPMRAFAELHDDVRNAVDYAAVAASVKELVSRREDKLIETLASVLAEHLLERYPINRVRVELRKFILPDARHTAVVLFRSRSRSG